MPKNVYIHTLELENDCLREKVKKLELQNDKLKVEIQNEINFWSEKYDQLAKELEAFPNQK